MSDYQVQTVWPEPPHDVREEAVRFWVSESAMNAGQAAERSRQLLVVARDHTGQIAAVSTAFPRFIEQFGFRCFYFRSFVGRAHRIRGIRPSGLIQQLIRESYDVLNARFTTGTASSVLGMYFEVENEKLIRSRPQLIWNELGANIVFVGVLPNGNHARVWYFERATF